MGKNNLSYQLGFWVGKEIARFHLPTLSVDSTHGYRKDNIIEVTEEETKEINRLDKEWHRTYGSDKSDISSKKFGELLEYRNELARKYLEESLTVHVEYIDTTNLDLEEFRDGMSTSIWDCDYSWYVVKKEDFIDSDKHMFVSFIKLELHIGDNPYL